MQVGDLSLNTERGRLLHFINYKSQVKMIVKWFGKIYAFVASKRKILMRMPIKIHSLINTMTRHFCLVLQILRTKMFKNLKMKLFKKIFKIPD